MKRVLIASAGLLFFGSMPAMAACPDDINKVRSDLQANQTFQQRYSAGEVDRLGYLRLFDAAQTFSDMGLESRCQSVLSGIREVAEKANEPRTAPEPGKTETRAMRLKSAQPLTNAEVGWSNLVGADVRNPADDDLGEVADLVMDKGRITAIIVERGGFLGMGQRHHMIATSNVMISLGTDAEGDARLPIVVIDMTPDQIKAMPSLRKQDGRWVNDAGSPPSVAPAAPPQPKQ